MPYGIHSASQVFQVKVAQIIERKEGCLNSQDQILLWADRKKEHDGHVHEVLSKVRDSQAHSQPQNLGGSISTSHSHDS